MKIQIINGPNLNLLGKREPNIYGNQSFSEFRVELSKKYPNCQINYFQSNIEGEIIDKIQEIGFDYQGIILNAGGYTHTSVAIRDAIKSIDAPVVEVHISNVYGRESFRHTSIIASVCKGIIAGFGIQSYELALHALVQINNVIEKTL